MKLSKLNLSLMIVFMIIVTDQVLSRYDHADLSELPEYRELPATAENMAMHIFAVLNRALALDHCRLRQVTVFETPTAWATWTRDEDCHA